MDAKELSDILELCRVYTAACVQEGHFPGNKSYANRCNSLTKRLGKKAAEHGVELVQDGVGFWIGTRP